MTSNFSNRDTNVKYRLAAGGFTAVQITGPFPDVILTAGMAIRVWDLTAVDAAADDMVVVLHYIEYDVV